MGCTSSRSAGRVPEGWDPAIWGLDDDEECGPLHLPYDPSWTSKEYRLMSDPEIIAAAPEAYLTIYREADKIKGALAGAFHGGKPDPDLTTRGTEAYMFAETGATLDAVDITMLAHESWNGTNPADEQSHQPSGKRGEGSSAPYSGGGAWFCAATLVYLCGILPQCHEDDRFKSVALRLLARVSTNPQGHQGNSLEAVMELLQSVVNKLALELCPEMMRYRRDNRLDEVLGRGIRAGDPGLPIDHRSINGTCDRLCQRGYLALFDEAIVDEFQRRGYRGSPADDDFYESGYRHAKSLEMIAFGPCTVALFAEWVNPYFILQTRDIGATQRSPPTHSHAPPKTSARMENKGESDYRDAEEYPPPTAMHNKDIIRKSIRSRTGQDQLETFREISKDYEILWVKNTFALTEDEAQRETQGMMQILLNIKFEPVWPSEGWIPGIDVYIATVGTWFDFYGYNPHYVEGDPHRHEPVGWSRLVRPVITKHEYDSLPTQAVFDERQADPATWVDTGFGDKTAKDCAFGHQSMYTRYERQPVFRQKGEPITIADIVAMHQGDREADQRGLLGDCASSDFPGFLGNRCPASRHDHERAFDYMLAMLPMIGERPIAMVAELQLHLDYFVEQRRKTHLWFKISRVPRNELFQLKQDCRQYKGESDDESDADEDLSDVSDKN